MPLASASSRFSMTSFCAISFFHFLHFSLVRLLGAVRSERLLGGGCCLAGSMLVGRVVGCAGSVPGRDGCLRGGVVMQGGKMAVAVCCEFLR